MSDLTLQTSLFLFILSFVESGKLVCKNLSDYRFMENNPNCYFNPDVDEHPKVIAQNNGYFLDTIKIITNDGYILDLYHLVNHPFDTLNDRPPILLQHGILSYGHFFMGIGNKSLAFAFLNKGYDVWLSNFRTILRKNGNVKMTSFNPKYYDFSYYEMGTIDLPIFIDYVRKHNRSPEKLIYFGYSLGTTLGYVYSSLKPDEAKQNLKAIFNLASCAFFKNVKSSLFRSGLTLILSKLFTFYPFQYVYEQIVFYTGRIIAVFCYDLRMMEFCKYIIDLCFGMDDEQFQAENLPSILFGIRGWLPEIIKDLEILYETKQFIGKNRTSKYPEMKDFPLDKIRVPVYIFQAEGDFAASINDAKETVKKLTNTFWKLTIVDKNSDIKFGHLDMFFGKHVDVLYKQILDQLDKLENQHPSKFFSNSLLDLLTIN